MSSLFFKFRTSRSGSGNGSGSGAGAEAGGGAPGMECGVAALRGAGSARSPGGGKALHVNFSDKGEVKERREKFLTAKYGSHQMALIRKRLAVEMWLYDELQKLYEPPLKEGGGGEAAREVEVDVDELLDMDGDDARRQHLGALLKDATKPHSHVHKFINELLEKAKTL